MKKYMHCVYIISTVIIAVIASTILYKAALSSYMLDSPTDVYFSTVMLLHGMFGMMDLFIAVLGIFLCVKLNNRN
jgi:hypothetical protein